MNIVLPWLIIIALVVTLISVVYVALKDRKTATAEIKRLTSELEGQKKINTELLNYTKEMAKIKSDKDSVAEKIDEAKNDEEVMAIIAGLVSANNDRVRK